MSTRPLRIGLIGAGFLAATRARCWRRVHGTRVALTAVTARRPERAQEFARRQGIAHVATDVAALLRRDDVDLVDLCVPNALHRECAVAAAQAGKHIVCTKPLTAYVGQDLPATASDAEVAGRDPHTMLALAVADADAMVTAAARAGVRLLYGENWLFAPSVTRAAALLAASTAVLLDLRGWEQHSGSHSPFSRQWRTAGGGALLRLGSHPIGAMLALKHQEGLRRRGTPTRVVAVTAEVTDLTRARTQDRTPAPAGYGVGENWGCAVLAFDDGTRGVAYGADTCLGGMQSRLELYASDCQFQCNLSPQDGLRAFAPTDGTFGQEYLMEKLSTQAGWSTPMLDEDWSSGQQAMCEAFAAAAATGAPCLSDGVLGREVVRVVYAAYVSAREGRRVVLPAPAD